MPERYPKNWRSWNDLTEEERRFAVVDKGFWTKLSEEQKQLFLNQADWQEVRLVPEAKQAYLASLVSLDEICKYLGVEHVHIWFLMSTRKLPAALVDGVWKFNRNSVERWVETMSGLEAVRKDADAQIAKHRAAREAH